jgi:hypothetical protein
LFSILIQGTGEFEWHRRLDPFNHSPLLGLNFTTVWDSTPFEISQPTDAAVFARTNAGKDKMNGFKAMYGFTFTGLPVAEGGLYFPKIYDARLMQRIDLGGKYTPHPQEMRVGDCHFSTALHFVVPPARLPHQPLTVPQTVVYNTVQMIRSPVEQGMRMMKLNGICSAAASVGSTSTCSTTTR